MGEEEVLGFTEDPGKDDIPTKDDPSNSDDSDEKELGEGEEEYKPDHEEKGESDVLGYTADKEDEEEVEEEKVKKEVGEEVEEDEKKELTEDEKIKEEVINYLSEEEGGTKYRIKGKDYDLRDLSPKEFRQRFSLAGRAYQRMEEAAEKEKKLIERERIAEDGARRAQEIIRGQRDTSGEAGKVKTPDFLKEDADDTPNEAALKKMNIELLGRVDKLEKTTEEQSIDATEQQIHRQLDELVEEFPMASKEQIIAVKYNYPDANVKDIAERSHNERISDEYLDAVFKARPDKLREIEEKGIEKHLAKKTKAGKVSRKGKSSSTTSSKLSTGTKKVPRTFDDIEDRLDEVKKIAGMDYLDD